MTKNEALLILAQKIMDTRLKPMIDKALVTPKNKPIAVNKALYDNDYMEWQAKQENKLVHINNRKDDNNGR